MVASLRRTAFVSALRVVRLHPRIKPMALLLAAPAILLPACAVTKSFSLMPLDGGSVASVVFRSGALAQSGEIQATFDGNRFLHGRWTQLDSGVRLESLYVTTPNGRIDATSLVQKGQPSGVATLVGSDLTALCVFTGTAGGGVANCADSKGRRYSGNW
jgi:hypothetical protein